MKRLKMIATILLAVCIPASLAACGGGTDAGGVSTDASAPQSVSEAGQNVSAAEQSAPEKPVYTDEEIAACAEENEQIAKLLNRETDRTLPARNVFYMQKYTFNRSPSTDYNDDKFEKLTDGKSSDVFDRQIYVAWKGGQTVTIDFDLGIVRHDLADVDVGCLRQISYGIGLPSYAELLISSDGENYYTVGKQMRPQKIEDSARHIFRFALPEATTARFVRIVLGKPDAAFIFVDEIWGYEYRKDTSVDRTPGGEGEKKYDMIDDIYKCTVDGSEPRIAVDSSDADYDKVQNLAMLDTTELLAQNFEPVPSAYNSNTSVKNFKVLTDGVYPGSEDRSAGKWACFQRGSGRHVIADLGCDMAVSGFKTVFLDCEQNGVGAPPASYISLSSDGVNWVSVYGDYNPNYGSRREPSVYVIDARFKDVYKARFVRISFATEPSEAVSTLVYMGELEVTGKKNCEGAAAPEENTDTHYGRMVLPEEYGIHNILFAPVTDKYGVHCTSQHVLLTEGALEYLYYRNKEGVIEGKMFDCVAFSTRNEISNHKDLYESMNFYYSELFDYDGMNMNALEEAQEQYNKELGKSEKIKVMISVDCPCRGYTFRGEDASTMDKIVECLTWEADEIIRRFEEKNYRNIEFTGFYWHHESIRDNTEDVEAIKRFNEYVHSKGYISHWCPYFNAKGYWKNRELGFDITCLQPGYMFHPETVYARLTCTYELARIYGMCVEIEIEDYSSTSATNRYYDYLSAGVETGYMKAVKVYYQGAFPGVYCGSAQSEEELRRRVYDMTGHYAMEILTPEELDFAHADTGEFRDKTVEVKAGEHADFTFIPLTDLVYRILQSPLYGDYGLNTDGTAYYKPKKGFLGEDKLIMQIVDDNGELKTAEITFNVAG